MLFIGGQAYPRLGCNVVAGLIELALAFASVVVLKQSARKSFGMGWTLVAPASRGYYGQSCAEEKRFEEGVAAAAVVDAMAGATA